MSFHAQDPAPLLGALDATRDGLSSAEAAARLARVGPNVIGGAPPERALAVLWRQVRSPLVLVLIASGTLAMALGKGLDGAVVLAVVVLNTIVGFVQEWRAGRAIEALQGMVAEGARVRRDGVVTTVPAADLVPGDVVLLEAGDRVAADLRLLAVRGLEAAEAALTGESLPVAKQVEAVPKEAPLGDRRCMAYGGTLVTAGTGAGLVVATGAATELGRISALLARAAPGETPLVQALARVARTITTAVVVVAMALAGVALARGYPAADALLAAITLAVAAIPEGLPAIVTIALAIGVQRMARRRAVVRQLPAVETLGATTTICSDKTGTLTRNEMTVQALWTPATGAVRVTGVGYAPEGEVGRADTADVRALLEAATLCADARLVEEPGRAGADAWRIEGDPTEGALVVAAGKAGLDAERLRADWPRVDAIPFDSARQWMATAHRVPRARDDGGALASAPDGAPLLVCLKGAPEAVLARCARTRDGAPLDDARAAEVLAAVDVMARQGMRVLGVAARPLAEAPGAPDGTADVLDERTLPPDATLLGLAGMIDPPRPEAMRAIAACRAAGIRVAMITGDHRTTAEAIGGQLGLLATRAPGGGPDGAAALVPNGGAPAGRTPVGEAPAGEAPAGGAPAGGAPAGGAPAGEAPAALTGVELQRMDDDALRAAVGRTRVFARVAPEEKLRLVRALQREGHVVAMTGDGVNDAPALKQADIGLAMGITGTAVARESAAVVLTDDNFATIVAAVEEGRRVYDNLVKALVFVLPTNLGEALVILAAVVAFPIVGGTPLLPMQPVQILWINLVATVALALPLAFEAAEPDVMARPPRAPGTPLLDRFVLWRTWSVAVLMAAGAIALFLWELRHAGGGVGVAVAPRALAAAQTAAVTSVVLMQVVYVLLCRSLTGPVRRVGWWSNPLVYAGVGGLLALQAAFVYAPPLQRLFGTAPLDAGALARAAGVALAVWPLVGGERLVRRHRNGGF